MGRKEISIKDAINKLEGYLKDVKDQNTEMTIVLKRYEVKCICDYLHRVRLDEERIDNALKGLKE